MLPSAVDRQGTKAVAKCILTDLTSRKFRLSMAEPLRCLTWALQLLNFKAVITKSQRPYETIGRSMFSNRLLKSPFCNTTAQFHESVFSSGLNPFRNTEHYSISYKPISLHVSLPCIFSGASIGQNYDCTDIYILYLIIRRSLN